jgi:Skp family chaperone for outer membrane proteins
MEDSGDFGLGQEWVESMLKENAQTLARMREELDGMRRELERLESSGTTGNAEQIKQSMARLLDRQEAELRKLYEQAGEMRKVMAAEVVE